jgi:hypothetical protein
LDGTRFCSCRDCGDCYRAAHAVHPSTDNPATFDVAFDDIRGCFVCLSILGTIQKEEIKQKERDITKFG